MRTVSLVLLLLGVLTYLLPYYRAVLPFDVPLYGSNITNVAALLVIAGLVALVWSRR